MFFIIISIIVCAYSLFCAITIFSDNQYKLTESVDQLYRIIEEQINSFNSVRYQSPQNTPSKSIEDFELIIKYIESINSLHKQASTNEILSFLYIFITTIFVGGGAYILKQLNNKSSKLNTLISKQNITIEKNQDTLTQQSISIVNSQDQIAKQSVLIKENQDKLLSQDTLIRNTKSEIDNQIENISQNKKNIDNQTELNKLNEKIVHDYGVYLDGRQQMNKIIHYANASQNSMLMIEILYHTGKTNIEIESSPYIPTLTDNIRKLLEWLTRHNIAEVKTAFLEDDLKYILISVDRILEMIKSIEKDIKPLKRIRIECEDIYQLVLEIKHKLFA